MKEAGATVRYPHATPPMPGTAIAVQDGILWTRLPLPYQLDHVNVYLIEDHDGFAVLDTGVNNVVSRQVWDTLIANVLRGKRVTKVIVSHFHPDHIGLAGWLCGRFGAPLYASQTTYLSSINITVRPEAGEDPQYRDFYLRHGLAPSIADYLATRGHAYVDLVHPVPNNYRRMVGGGELTLGGRAFRLISGEGHAPEQIMLVSGSDKVFLAADQVLSKITPNVSVWAVEPAGDPLGLYLSSLRTLKEEVNPEALVLPGHQLPFYGLYARIDEIIAHHGLRCELIMQACKCAPRSVAEVIPMLFHNELDPHQMSFAFAETQAHINYLASRGALESLLSPDRVERVRCRV